VVRLSGLRMRMAVSYVLVTAAAVVLVEGIVVGLLLPRVLASSSNASRAAVARQAGADAKLFSAAAVNMARKMPAGTTSAQLMRLLAGSSQAHATVAGGDFRPRVQVSGEDEIGRLEDAFNRMTGRLSAAASGSTGSCTCAD
jgi:HAMP domain-containing protein